ncbi:MAG: hypothetical protein ACPL7L_02325, partial [bacterium]
MKLKRFLIWVCSIVFFLACFAFPNFGLAQNEKSFFILPSQIELLPSSETRVSLIVLGANEPAKVVRFSVKQTPPGLELSFDPPELKVPGISQLVLKTNSTYLPGNYFLEITADFGDQIKLAVLNLTTRKGLEIKLSNSSISLFPQDQANLGFYIYKLNPESHPVFQIQNLPPGIESSFSPPLELDSYTITCTLMLSSSMDTKPG